MTTRQNGECGHVVEAEGAGVLLQAHPLQHEHPQGTRQDELLLAT